MEDRFDLEQLELFQEADWIEGSRFMAVIDRWIGAQAAVALARMFWPSFIDYRGGVFLDFSFSEDNVDHWMESVDGDVVAVESVVNHTHLWDVFDKTLNDVPHEALTELGEVLCRCWRCAVNDAYLDRDFVVALENEPGDYGPTLYLHSRREDDR